MTPPAAPLRPLRTDVPSVVPIGLRLADAARVIGLAPRTLRRLVSEGKVPASRPGGRALVFAVRDLEALLARTRVGGAA